MGYLRDAMTVTGVCLRSRTPFVTSLLGLAALSPAWPPAEILTMSYHGRVFAYLLQAVHLPALRRAHHLPYMRSKPGARATREDTVSHRAPLFVTSHTACQNDVMDAVVTSVPDDVVASAPPHALPPFGGDRSDRAMQNIVDKVFPHFAKEEAAAESLVSERVQIFVPGVVLRTLSPNTNPNLDATYKSNYNPSLSHLNPRTHTNAHTHTHMHGTARKLCLSLFPNPETRHKVRSCRG
jgi:hypothetical protein